MMPLQVIILAMIVLAYAENAEHRPGPVSLSPALLLITVLATHAAVLAFVWAQGRRARRLLFQPTVEGSAVAIRLDRFTQAARWATVLLAGVQVWGLGWGAWVMRGPEGGWGVGRTLLIPDLILMAPALLTWIGFWFVQYGVDEALKERSLAYRLATGLPAHEMPGRAAYLSMQIRHNFGILAMLGLVTAAQRALTDGDRTNGLWFTGATVLGLAFLLVGLPWAMTRIWSTEPLTGPLRARLDAVADRYGVRFRNIMLWKTHHFVSNAMIMGFVPIARYFLMSDALLETLTDRQIEAVFAHEVGHGRHRHVWWYALVFSTAGMAIDLLVSVILQFLLAAYPAQLKPYEDDLGLALYAVFFGAFIIWGFGWLSRRFEHQADWFAARHMAYSLQQDPERLAGDLTIEQYMQGANKPPVGAPPFGVPPLGGVEGGDVTRASHPPSEGGASSPPSVSPCLRGEHEPSLAAGAEIFSSALTQIVTLAHRALDRGGWLHPSVQRRAALLSQLAHSPEAAARFERRLVWIRVVVAGLFAAVAIFEVLLNQTELLTCWHQLLASWHQLAPHLKWW